MVRYPHSVHVFFPKMSNGVDLRTNPISVCVSTNFLPEVVVTFIVVLIHRSIHTIDEFLFVVEHARSTGTPLAVCPSCSGDMIFALSISPDSIARLISSYGWTVMVCCGRTEGASRSERAERAGVMLSALIGVAVHSVHTPRGARSRERAAAALPRKR